MGQGAGMAHDAGESMSAMCPVCKTFVKEGWVLDFKRENVEVLKLKDHRCPEQRPTRLLQERN